MKKRKNKKKELTLKEATLMDDEFMKNIFIYNSSIPEILIRTVMEEVEGQTDLDFDSSSIRVERLMQNSFGHSSRYDYFEKANGCRFILELQRNKYQFTPKRSRFYFSLADSLSLKKGDSYEQLDEIYQIVFSDGDIFNDNLAVGHYVMIEKETHRILDNGIHLIHVNCSHPDFPEKYKKIKLLAEDIMEANPDKIHNEEIRNTYYEIGKNVERSDNMSAMTINKLFDEVQKVKKVNLQYLNELKDKDNELKRKDEEHQKEIENKNERIKLLENALLKNNIELPSV